jgi:hypothetical protein
MCGIPKPRPHARKSEAACAEIRNPKPRNPKQIQIYEEENSKGGLRTYNE